MPAAVRVVEGLPCAQHHAVCCLCFLLTLPSVMAQGHGLRSQTAWVQISALTPTGYVAFGKLLYLSGPQCPHL